MLSALVQGLGLGGNVLGKGQGQKESFVLLSVNFHMKMVGKELQFSKLKGCKRVLYMSKSQM